ncbi:MAG: fructosamine kinase family protein, partial [Gammaproteobacteria bacterium]|nr:fructosamine kinase family protein [Gammaproteobacteria bacterium]
INSAWRVQGRDRIYFVKTNAASLSDMFAAEFEGLQEIKTTKSIRVPAPICHGAAEARSFLVLEWLDTARHSPRSDEILGTRLAAMHRHTASKHGWRRDNTIGSTPQINARGDNWVEFFQKNRLGFQLRLATDNGYGGSWAGRCEKLVSRVPELFETYTPPASLLHGDLWGGNKDALADGEPVVFDPAVYYGDRETDIAMTELFGGFNASFYAAYNEAWALDDGYAVRKHLYQLYHLLNHLNIFGSGYLGQCSNLVDKLLAEF